MGVNDKLKECLSSFMLEDWRTANEILLNETISPEAKREALQGIFNRQLREPLALSLNGMIDIPIITEGMEDKLFHLIVDKVLETTVSCAVLSMEKTDFV